MDRKSQIVLLLDSLYPDPPRPLHGESEFQFLVAIVLSAQTIDVAVNNCTRALFAAAPDADSMSKLALTTIEKMIGNLGLYRNKAKYLSGLSKVLVDDHNGIIPAEFDDIVALPGVGKKTASCFLSQARGVPYFAVDTHVARLANRWGLSKQKDPSRIQEDLQDLFPKDKWAKLHLQFIYFGREYCRAKSHDVKSCPVCYAFSAEGKHASANDGSTLDTKRVLASCSPPATPPGKNILLYAEAEAMSNKLFSPNSCSSSSSAANMENEKLSSPVNVVNLSADLDKEVVGTKRDAAPTGGRAKRPRRAK